MINALSHKTNEYREITEDKLQMEHQLVGGQPIAKKVDNVTLEKVSDFNAAVIKTAKE